MSYDDFDIDKARELREKARDGFARQSRKSLIATLLVSLPLMALILFAAMKWGNVAEAESRMFYSLLFLCGLLMHTGVWASYGLDARLLVLLKEIKQLRLDFLSSGDAPPERATGGVESISSWRADALKPKRLVIVIAAVCVLALGVALLSHRMTYPYRYSEAFGGQEVAEVHVTPEGTFRVHSRVSITKCAPNVASIPLHIPHPGATLESVTIDGRALPFAPVPGEKDTYTIMPGLPEHALKSATLEVVWAPQASDVDIRGDGRSLQLQMQGLVPVTAYTANVLIDDGAPFEFAGRMAPVRNYNMYWTKRPYEDYNGNSLGSCGIAVRAVPGGE